jgi:hypothetical protein
VLLPEKWGSVFPLKITENLRNPSSCHKTKHNTTAKMEKAAIILVIDADGNPHFFPADLVKQFKACNWKYLSREGYEPHVENDVLIVEGNCITQARYNKENKYKGRPLKLVFGCLGIGIEKPFYEFGDLKFQTLQDMINEGNMKLDPETNQYRLFDCHCWLEDIHTGRIYDVATSICHAVAIFHSKRYHFEDNEILEGFTKEQAQAKGLHYHPFNEQLQKELHDVTKDSLKSIYQKFCSRFGGNYVE